MTQTLAAVKPHPNFLGLVWESVLPRTQTDAALASDKVGLESVVIAIAAHQMLHKGQIVPDKIKISGEQDLGKFAYVKLSYMDKPQGEMEDGGKQILFDRRYTYLVDTYSQTAMPMDVKF